MGILVTVLNDIEDRKLTFYCEETETVQNLKDKCISEGFMTKNDFLLVFNGNIIKNETNILMRFGSSKITMKIIMKDLENTLTRKGNISFKDVTATDEDEIIVKGGVKYLIKEKTKKLSSLERILKNKELFKRHFKDVIDRYLNNSNVNTLLLLLFLVKFNKSMFMFVIFVKAVTFFNFVANNGSKFCDSVAHSIKVSIFFIISLFLIDHQRLIKKCN